MFSHKKPAEKSSISNTFSDAFTNEVFVRKETWLQRNMQMDERCTRESEALQELKDGQDSINKKINATLVTVIATLASILVGLAVNGLHF